MKTRLGYRPLAMTYCAAALLLLCLGPGCATQRMWSHAGYEASAVSSAAHDEDDRFTADIVFANGAIYRVAFPGERGAGEIVEALDRSSPAADSPVVPIEGAPTPLEVYVTRGELRVTEGGEHRREYPCPRVEWARDPTSILFALATPVTAVVDVIWTPAVWLFDLLQRGRH